MSSLEPSCLGLTEPCLQALSIADDITFSNCLVAMRPQTKKKELPTRTTVKNNINNKFVDYIEELRADIQKAPGDVSTAWDMWTAPHTSDSYFGMFLQWIDIDFEAGTWKFRDEVAACHKVLGNHGGENLGRYFILFLDRAGVTSKTHNKVSPQCLAHSRTRVADAVNSLGTSQMTTRLTTRPRPRQSRSVSRSARF